MAMAILALMAAAAGCEADEPTAEPPATAKEATSNAAATPEPTATPATTPTAEAAATPAAELPSVREILEKAAVAMGAVETGSVKMEVEASIEGTSTFHAKSEISGDFHTPNLSQFTAVISSGGISATHESIVIGEQSYIRDPARGSWETGVVLRNFLQEDEYLGELNLHLASDVIDHLSLVGTETPDGDYVYYVKGSLPSEAAANLVHDSGMADSAGDAPVSMEIWIGAEDFLVRKVVFGFKRTNATSGDKSMVQNMTTYSDYGKAVAIQAPELASGQGFTSVSGDDDHGDKPEAATRLMVGYAAVGHISDYLDVDYFVFKAEGGKVYNIEVSLGTLDEAAITLYDPYGEELAYDDENWDRNGPSLIWEPSDSGNYYVAVEGVWDGTYALSIGLATAGDDHSNSTRHATPVTFGETLVGYLDYDRDLDYFAFHAEQGELYRVDVNVGEMDYHLVVVYDANGEELTHYSSFDPASSLFWETMITGEFYFSMQGLQTGEYTLAASVSDIDDDYANSAGKHALPITLGKYVEGELHYEGDLDYFSFQAVQGDFYRIELSPEGLSDAGLRMYDVENGLRVYSYFGHSRPEVVSLVWEAPVSGDHYVGVESWSRETGNYSLTIANADINDDHSNAFAGATTVALGGAVDGELNFVGDEDFFRFQATGGQAYLIKADMGTVENWDVTLLYGDRIERAVTNNLNVAHIAWEAPLSGEYHIKVEGGWWGIGAYTLSITEVEDVSQVPRPTPTSPAFRPRRTE